MRGHGLVLIVVMLASVARVALADGIMFADRVINEPEQKAIIYFHNGEEDLIISPAYQGAVEQFAWIVPVPSRPKVEIMPGDLFGELLDYTGPLAPSSPGEVAVLERKIVGDYDVSVLSASGSAGLTQWLSDNRYNVPEKAAKPLQNYIDKGWTFVACKVADPKAERGLRAGILKPLRLTFRTNRPIYPLKLSVANPEPFNLLVLLLMPTPEIGDRWVALYPTPKGALKPRSLVDSGFVFHFTRETIADDLPVLAKLTPGPVGLFYLCCCYDDSKVRPEQCIADLSWEVWVRLPRKPWNE